MQEHSLAAKIHAAEGRLQRYRASVLHPPACITAGYCGHGAASLSSVTKNERDVQAAERAVRRVAAGRPRVKLSGKRGGRQSKTLWTSVLSAMNGDASDVVDALDHAEFAARGAEGRGGGGRLRLMSNEVEGMQRRLNRLRGVGGLERRLLRHR